MIMKITKKLNSTLLHKHHKRTRRI
jgi:hypothetical protein